MHVATAARLDSRATWQTHDRWREGWGVAFAKRVYTAEFGEGASISDRKVLGAILREIGQDADRLLARAGEPEVKERLRQQTEEAQELRLRLRQERSKPILDSIWQWGITQKGLPRSEFGKAVRYMLERWEKLMLFVDNPLVWLDNNHAERALRGPVVGRKNHYGSRSKRGTEVAALFYSLCETAKLQNVEPRAFMLRAAYAAIENPGAIVLPSHLLAGSAA